MKTISLVSGETVMIDDADYELVATYKWNARRVKNSERVYAQTSVPTVGGKRKQRCITMHALLTGAPKGLQVDHKDGNGLNNQRGNFRVGTCGDNMRGFKRKERNCTSRYRGVYFERDRRLWRASIGIKIDGKTKCFNLGRYKTEEEAALAYNTKALQIGFFPEALNAVPKAA